MPFTFIDVVFFFYMFVGLYLLFLLLFIYFPHRKELFSYPPGRAEPVSIVMPCYNEGKHIEKALDALLKLDYPEQMIEIIVVDDCSTDTSVERVRRVARKHSNVRLIVNRRNSGGAAEPTNIGVQAARYPYVAVVDADSVPEKDALRKMIGFLQSDARVAGVTCAVMAQKPDTFMQHLQAIEYAIIAWSRKLLDLIDAVYVTPGPLALYRKDALLKVGLFDTNNLTQDIEIVWRLLSKGYKVRMCLDAAVYSATPARLRAWYRQRVRWNIGGTQTLLQYKRLFFRRGMLGAFILPFFSFSLFLGLIGLGMFAYLTVRRFMVWYLSSAYSLYADSAIVRLQELTFSPSILNYFGGVLFLAGTLFTFAGLGIMRNKHLAHPSFMRVLFYMLIYLTIYPLIMITALVKLAIGRYTW